MADWFQFKNIKSTAMGVYVTTYPPITLPEERVEFVTVPGRSGALTIAEGDCVYEDITLSVDCLVRDLSKLDQMSAWLRGAGELVLGNRPGTFYRARVVNQIELTKLMRGRQHRTFSVVFRCAPFRYVYSAPNAITLSAPGSVTNHGSVYAEPIITVTGDGDIDLTVAGKTLQLSAIRGSINIGRTRLFCWLRDHGYLMEDNKPYQKYLDRGLFAIREYSIMTTKNDIIKTTTLVTGKGRVVLLDALQRAFGVASQYFITSARTSIVELAMPVLGDADSKLTCTRS